MCAAHHIELNFPFFSSDPCLANGREHPIITPLKTIKVDLDNEKRLGVKHS